MSYARLVLSDFAFRSKKYRSLSIIFDWLKDFDKINNFVSDDRFIWPKEQKIEYRLERYKNGNIKSLALIRNGVELSFRKSQVIFISGSVMAAIPRSELKKFEKLN